jgi:OmpA-OmpF porin, OOP family
MKIRKILFAGAAAFIAIANPITGNAADQDVGNRFYGGIGLGASRLDKSDDNGSVFKLYGGYQITENFGVEAGYMRFGDVTRTYSIGGDSLTQTGKARAFYTAGTVRWQFSDSFSVNGLAGVAFNQVRDDATIGDRNLNGDKRSVMLGLGAQYQLSERTALTVNFDHLAEISEEGPSSDVVTAGLVMRF